MQTHPMRRPDLLEPNPNPAKSRWRRLHDFVTGTLAGDDRVCLVYWSPQDGGRWVAWLDPDPIGQANVEISP